MRVSNPNHLAPAASRGATQTANPLHGFTGSMERIPVDASYRMALGWVAAVMFMLPVIYAALVAGVAALVAWHATANLDLLWGEGRLYGWRVMALRAGLYVTPLVTGALVVLVMLKPFFARRSRRDATCTLRREDEPVLYAFVDRLAGLVGAPKPARIDVNIAVNASASFENGVWSLLDGRLTLTIGLPLAGGLTLRQLAGVLAHELGHFAQGAGMRLCYVTGAIRSWLRRVVYGRDSWDDALEGIVESGGAWALMGVCAQFGVGVSRLALSGLLLVADAVSANLSREMEFDADRYEARVAGSDTFRSTAIRLYLLHAAQSSALAEADDAWNLSRRRATNLPFAALGRIKSLPANAEALAIDAIRRGATHWQDTHPSDRDRIRNAEAEFCRGIFQGDEPGHRLFRDFKSVSERATAQAYSRA